MALQINPGNLGSIISVMGITNSQRPCKVPTCSGEVRALLYRYDKGHRLIWRCDRCHMESDYGPSEAIVTSVVD